MKNKDFYYCFNPEENGGEAFYLATRIEKEDPEDSYMTQSLVLNSYGKEANFNIPMYLTPEKLRDCADQLEFFMVKHGLKG